MEKQSVPTGTVANAGMHLAIRLTEAECDQIEALAQRLKLRDSFHGTTFHFRSCGTLRYRSLGRSGIVINVRRVHHANHQARYISRTRELPLEISNADIEVLVVVQRK
jgi:hypothetical protein